MCNLMCVAEYVNRSPVCVLKCYFGFSRKTSKISVCTLIEFITVHNIYLFDL